MTRWLLDTNAVIAILNHPEGKVASRLRRHPPEHVAISSLVIHELYYGAFRSQRVEQNLMTVDKLQFEVLDFDREDAQHAGEIRAILALRGEPIGAYDVLIAGQARSRKMTLITRNVREFSRVTGLTIRNWED